MAAHTRFSPGPGRVDGFRIHNEAGSRAGGLSSFLAIPSADPDAFERAMRALRDPSTPASLEASLGRLAAAAPKGTGFLVAQGDEVWVFPSPRIRFHRVRADRDEAIRQPEVVRLKPRERVEVWGDGNDEFLGEFYLELPPHDASAPITDDSSEGPRLPRPLWRRPRLAVPLALGLAGVAAWGVLQWRDAPPSARMDAYVSGNLEDRVVEWMGSGSRERGDGTDGSVPLGAALPGGESEESLDATVALADAKAPSAEVDAIRQPVAGWEFHAEGPITSSPAVVDGRVVFGSRDSTLYCLQAATGEVAWTTSVGSGMGSSPCIVDGTCFVGTYDGKLVACDFETGKRRWSASTRGRIVSSPCVVGSNVIVGSYDRGIHAYDRETGEKRWTVTTQGIVRASPEPIGFDGVVIGSVDGTIYCLQGDTGAVRWKHKTASAFVAAASFDPASDRVVIGSHDGATWCLDAATGKVAWKTELGSEINGQPRFAEHGVLVGTGSGVLHALDPETGAIRWKRSAERGFDARPLVLGERVLAPSYDGTVWVLSAIDGTVVERRVLGSEVFSSPASGDQLVFVGTLGGTFHALALP
jgi:outer membrane protein assembly factor BamB